MKFGGISKRAEMFHVLNLLRMVKIPEQVSLRGVPR